MLRWFRSVWVRSAGWGLVLACGSSAPVEGARDQARRSLQLGHLDRHVTPLPDDGESTPPVVPADAGAPSPVNHRDRVEALVAPLLDGEWMQGVSVALIDHGAIESYGFGALQEGGATPDGKTIYQIGSVTKTFTSLLLADLVREGRVGLDDPVAAWLPPGVRVPDFDGRVITLLDLATHTSGLPRLATDPQTAEQPLQPYADFQVSDLYDFLANYTLPVEPGTRFEYSNLGVGLLGHALSLAAETSYDQAIQARIARPLGLSDTTVAPHGEQASRIATSHDADLEPLPAWAFTAASEGAGALYSTAADLARYVAAELDAASSNPSGDVSDAGVLPPVEQSMALTQIPRRPTEDGSPIGLAWFFSGNDLLWHNGGVAGYRSIVFFDRALGVGAVALSNTETTYTDSLGYQLYQLAAGGDPTPLDLPSTFPLGVEQLERCVGLYRSGEGTPVTITRDGTRLYLRINTDGPPLRLYATSETTFYMRRVEASVSFEPNDGESYKQLILGFAGESYTLTRDN